MKKLKLFFACLLMAVLSIGQVWGADSYEKVTSAPSDWSGEYLLVYESSATAGVTWTGVDAKLCKADVVISDGVISTVPSEAVTLTIATMTGGYSIVVNGGTNDGKYIYGTSGSNKTNFGTTATLNTLAYDATNKCVTITSNTSVMRYNKTASTGEWFRYYKSSSYTSQQAVQLYKKAAGGGGSSDPSLSLSKTSLNLEASGNATQNITLTATNFTDAVNDVTCAFYNTAACDGAAISQPAWITNLTDNNSNQVSFDVVDNDGAARNVWMKITASKGTESASAILAITQNAPVVDYATLPFAYDGNGSGDLPNGLTNHGVSTYASSPAMKFDGTGDYILIKINEDPGTLTYDILGNSFSGGTFKVQESDDNDTYTDVAEYTALTTTKLSESKSLKKTTRYVKFIYTSKSSGNVALGKIGISEYVAPAAVATPVISGDDPFLTETEVSITCETAGATIYYTTTESAKGTPATSGDWIAYDSENKPSFNATTTVWAAAIKGSDWSSVAEKTFTKTTALTTMDEIFAAATTTATPQFITFSSSWVVTGVSTNGKNVYITDGTKGMILYNNGANMGLVVGNTLSGTVQRSLKLYNGSAQLDAFTTEGLTIGTGSQPAVQELDATGIEALSGANTGSLIKISGECSEESGKFKIGGVQLYNSLYSFSVSAGTSYECTGVYVQYNTNTANTKEILPRSAADIVETSTIAVTGVTLTESTASIEAGDNVTLHATVEPSTATNKNIVWSVESGSDYASVADGVVTGIAAGEAVIRATSAENASIYDECTVTVSAADPTKHKVTFDATVDKGESPLSKSNITFTCSNGVLNNASEYRLYQNSTTTFACSAGNILKIEFTGVSGKPVSGFEDPEVGTLVIDGNDGVWTGNAESISFIASGAQVRATLIIVTYKEDTRAESGLAWDPADDIEITVGDLFTAPALLNPNSIDASAITIESDNTDLAVVNDGVVSLVADATGSTTITATFAGNETYKPATVSYNITVNGGALTDYYEKVTSGSVAEGTYLIVYEAGSLAFDGGADPLDAVGNSIAVDIVSGNKIGVTSATEAATFYIDPTAGTIQAASGKYIGQTSDANGLGTNESASAYTNSFSFDEGNAVIVSSSAHLCYNSASNQLRFRYYKSSSYSSQQPIALYKLANEVIKPASGLAWDPADDIEITVGDAFTAPTLLNPNSIAAADITIESSNTDLATVTNGVVELVADATGSATITATYTGETYKPTTVSYKIKVNPAASIYVSPSLNVNFGSVVKDAALPADKKITVTLNNVAAATATLGGTNPGAFSINPATLTESGDITISVIASTAAAATYSATITITDDATVAAEKVVNLSFAVTEPAAEETPVSTTSKWVPATEITDGMQVLIVGVNNTDYYAMGAQANNGTGNNRLAVAASVDGEGVLTPGENTMAFTVVEQPDGSYALQTSNDKYLYAASSSNNYLKTKDELDDNGKWTLTVSSAVANGTYTHKMMQFNSSSSIFACYTTSTTTQKPIALYVEQSPEPPTPTYTTVRPSLSAGRYYTICYPKAMTAIKGGTLWSFVGRDADFAYIQQESAPFAAGKPYLIYATAEKLEAVLEGEDAAAAGNYNGLYGTLSYMSDADLTGVGADYLLKNNELHPIGTGAYLEAQRAYIIKNDIPEGAPAHAPGKNIRSMPMHKDATTGIDDLNASDAPRKMVIDGTMFILRGEKLYDATGRMVK